MLKCWLSAIKYFVANENFVILQPETSRGEGQTTPCGCRAQPLCSWLARRLCAFLTHGQKAPSYHCWMSHTVYVHSGSYTPTCRIFSEKSSPSAVCVPLRPVRWFARACSVEHLMNFNRSCACTSRQVRSSFRSFLQVLPLVGSGWYSLRPHCYNTSECGRAPMVVAHSSG